MGKREKRSEIRRKIVVILPFILVFSILGGVVFSVFRRISIEMSEAAIDNLSESLGLISNTIETILNKEAEFQKLIAQEMVEAGDPEKFILSYERNSTMVKISLIQSGETEGISNTGEVFSEDKLDFSAGIKVNGDLQLSQSYINDMGTWAYTMKCPVVKEEAEIASLYIEYIYDSFDDALPDKFYNGNHKIQFRAAVIK